MGPFMLNATSDHPILELFVRSTWFMSAKCRWPGVVNLTLVLVPVLDIGEVEYSGIVVVLAGEDDVVEVCGMRIGNGMA